MVLRLQSIDQQVNPYRPGKSQNIYSHFPMSEQTLQLPEKSVAAAPFVIVNVLLPPGPGFVKIILAPSLNN